MNARKPNAQPRKAAVYRYVQLVAATAVAILSGCTSAPTTERFAGHTAQVSRNDRAQYNAKEEETFYNGEIVNGNRQQRAWAHAWWDYDAQFARYYIENIDQIAKASTGAPSTTAVPSLATRTVFPAPVDYNARFVRYYSAANLLTHALRLGSFQSPALAGFGLLVGNLGSSESFFRRMSKDELDYRTGSSLSLIRIQPAQGDLQHDRDAELAVKLLSDAMGYSGAPRVFLFNDSTTVTLRPAIVRPAIAAGTLPPGAPRTDATMQIEFYSRPHAIYHQAPAATLYPTGVTTTMRVPHIAFQGRTDGIQSARELYERRLRDNPLLGKDWIVIYTDRNADGQWRVFVKGQVDERTLEFPLPAAFVN